MSSTTSTTGNGSGTGGVETYEFTIRTTVPTNKKHFVARFPEKQTFEWSKLTPPVKLQKYETSLEDDLPAMPTIPTTGSRSQRRRQLEKFYQKKKEKEKDGGKKKTEVSWKLEEGGSKGDIYDGTAEPGQTANYVLFSMEVSLSMSYLSF
jgi:hypothetical protein